MFVMLSVLAISCWYAGRGPAALGLDMPLSPAGWWGLGAATVISVSLLLATSLGTAKLDDKARADLVDKVKANDNAPRTAQELAAFLPMIVVVCTGWELLYRGFLLMLLTPHIGAAGAIILSALAYGIGHGYTSRRQFVGSIVSAFLFTIAFYVTQSLWWLMVLHVALPLVSAVTSVVALRQPVRVPTP